MNLLDLVTRTPIEPFEAGGKIPWDDPGFSARMLKEHLSQAHDAASRRFETIDRHVAWIHEHVLGAEPTRVLDLGCGPGFYATRLARLGHEVIGLDFSPASIAHARSATESAGLGCAFRLADLRQGGYGEGFGLAMLVFGELNAFAREEASAILEAACEALTPGGRLVLEVESEASVKARGEAPASWFAAGEGLFSDRPYVCLRENAFFEEEGITVERFLVVDAASGDVTPYAVTTSRWTEAAWIEELQDAGFTHIERHPALDGREPESEGALYVLTARAETRA